MDSGNVGNIGVIVTYRYVDGPNTGRIFRKRFENVGSFTGWAAECDTQKIIKILSTRITEAEKLYWEDRFVKA